MSKSEMFKKLLQIYPFCKKESRRLKEELDLQWYDLENVKGVDPSKQPGSSNRKFMEQVRLDRLDEIEEMVQDQELYEMIVKFVDRKLDNLEDETRNNVVDLYVKGKTYITVSAENFVSDSGLFRRIENELNKNI